MARFVACAALTALLLAGCAGADVEGTEQMLAASGFAMQPATTLDMENELHFLPPHRLLMRPATAAGGYPTYVYADPDVCHCLWLGNAQNYQYLEQLGVQREIAAENLQAAQLNQDAAMEMMMPRPVIVVHEHH